MTIREIAKEAGVHPSTVSRVINKKSKISTETSKKIEEILKRENYQKNQAAANLKNKETRNILLVIYDLYNPFFTEVLSGIMEVLTSNKYTFVIKENKNYAAQQEVEQLIYSKTYDGVIFIASTINKEDYLKYSKELPVILCSETLETDEVISVILGEKEYIKTMVSDIKNLEKDSLIYVHGKVSSSSRNRRIKLLKENCIQNNISYQSVEVDDSLADVKNKIKFYLDKGCQAIVFNSDLFALYALEELSQYNNVSVTSFDGTYLLENLKFKYNLFYKRDLKKLGNETAVHLLKLINGENVSSKIL